MVRRKALSISLSVEGTPDVAPKARQNLSWEDMAEKARNVTTSSLASGEQKVHQGHVFVRIAQGAPALMLLQCEESGSVVTPPQGSTTSLEFEGHTTGIVPFIEVTHLCVRNAAMPPKGLRPLSLVRRADETMEPGCCASARSANSRIPALATAFALLFLGTTVRQHTGVCSVVALSERRVLQRAIRIRPTASIRCCLRRPRRVPFSSHHRMVARKSLMSRFSSVQTRLGSIIIPTRCALSRLRGGQGAICEGSKGYRREKLLQEAKDMLLQEMGNLNDDEWNRTNAMLELMAKSGDLELLQQMEQQLSADNATSGATAQELYNKDWGGSSSWIPDFLSDFDNNTKEAVLASRNAAKKALGERMLRETPWISNRYQADRAVTKCSE
eukprot:jgi/Bigna1/79081/fgenesh1_pg.59_\